jgi:hypothetical protein
MYTTGIVLKFFTSTLRTPPCTSYSSCIIEIIVKKNGQIDISLHLIHTSI